MERRRKLEDLWLLFPFAVFFPKSQKKKKTFIFFSKKSTPTSCTPPKAPARPPRKQSTPSPRQSASETKK